MNLSVPRPEPALDRAGILAAVAQAASASAAGVDGAAAQKGLDGRQFEFRIRFGCMGPSNNLRDASLGWSLDSETQTLRVRARPTVSADDRLVLELAGGKFEAVEGFWVPRPWLLQSLCPAAAAVKAPEAPSEADALPPAKGAAARPDEPDPSTVWPRVGIAQFFDETESRTGRRSMRAYEAVKTLEPDQPIGSQGFNLVLAGRLKALPGRGVIACASKNADSPPDCIVSADFDRVWIERPDTREIIAEWGSG